MEPGDRGSAPISSARLGGSAGGLSRAVAQNQFAALAERINAAVAGLQWQCSEDRRRLAQLERKVESRHEERAAGGDNSREKWAEIQGSVNGLIEETQSLTRRVESLDERLWSRTSGAEMSKQRNRELEQQVQALEHQSRLTSSAIEESQKRQATKLRRSEHAIEEAVRRLAKVEEQSRNGVQQRDSYLEARVNSAEQLLEQLSVDMRDMQMQLDDGFAAATGNMALPQDGGGVNDDFSSSLDDAMRTVATLDRRLTGQVEEMSSTLASLRVKVDGQLSRVGTLAERLETAHAPAMETLRGEMGQLRMQDRRELENQVALLRERTQEVGDGSDELREELRQARSEIAALSLRQKPAEDTDMLRALEDRCNEQERELLDIRDRLDAMPETGMEVPPMPHEGQGEDMVGGGVSAELEESLRACERTVLQLDKRLTGQVEEMTSTVATIRVKVDGQLQRVGSLAERIETAHEPAIESLRCEMAQQRGQDRRELEAQLATLQAKVAEAAEGPEEGAGDLREALMQVRTQIENLCKEDSPILAVIDERCAAQEEDLAELRERIEALASNADAAGAGAGAVAAVGVSAEVEEALAETEQALAGLEKRLTSQVEEVTTNLASLRVKVDGRLQSLSSDRDREPPAGTLDAAALEALRAELGQQRLKERKEIDEALLKLRTDLGDAAEEREGSVEQHEKELRALRGRIDSLQAEQQAADSPAKGGAGEGGLSAEVAAALRESEERLTEQVEEATTALEGLQSKLDTQLQQLGARISAAHEPALEALRAELSKLRDQDRKDLDAQLAALRERAAPPEAPAEAKAAAGEDVSKLKADLDKVRADMEAVRSARDKGDGDAAKKVTAIELRCGEQEGELKELREELKKSAAGAASSKSDAAFEIALAGLDKRLSAKVEEVTAALTSLDDKVDEGLQERGREGAVAKSVAGAGEDLAALKAQLEQQRLKERQSSEDAVAKLRGDLQGALEEMKGLRGRMDALPSTPAGAGAGDAALARGDGAADEVARSKVQSQVEDMVGRLAQELSSLTRHQQELLSMQTSLDSLAAKVAEGPKGAAAGADSAAVASLSQKLEQAVKRLTAVEAASKEAAVPKKDGGGEAPAALSSKLEDALRRVTSVEDASSFLRRDLDQMQGTAKVGIGLGSSSPGGNFSMADLRSRLDLLAEQVSELQTRQAAGGGGGSRRDNRSAGGGVPTPDASLNFSLTEQNEKPGGKGADGSLNFSLTDAKLHGGDNSANFSLTESKGDFSLSESCPILNNPPPRKKPLSAAGTPADAAVSKGRISVSPDGSLGSDDIELVDDEEISESSESSPSNLKSPGGSKSKSDSKSGSGGLGGGGKSKVGLGGADADELLEQLARGEAVGPKKDSDRKDAKDSSGGSASSRARPTGAKTDLQRVDEEGSDFGDNSLEGSGQSRSGEGSKPPSAGNKSRSADAMLRVPESPASNSNTDLGNLDVSASCNDVSFGGDYSVEDSCELDKCDHVEEVRPMGPLSKVMAAASAAASAGSADAGGGAGEGGAIGSRAGVPDSPTSASASCRADEALDVSISCNEMSFGADYSVEGSKELDKCDFVEDVRPAGPLAKKMAETSAAGRAGVDALDMLTAGRAKVEPNSVVAPKASDALDSLLGGGSGGGPSRVGLSSASAAPPKGATKAATPISPKSSSKGKAGDDDYEESFEDDMSVPESIEEDSDV